MEARGMSEKGKKAWRDCLAIMQENQDDAFEAFAAIGNCIGQCAAHAGDPVMAIEVLMANINLGFNFENPRATLWLAPMEVELADGNAPTTERKQ